MRPSGADGTGSRARRERLRGTGGTGPGSTLIMPPCDPADLAPSISRTGRLVRHGGAFVLQGIDGARIELRLMRVPVDHVGKFVTVIGHMLGPALMEVEGVSAG